MYINNEKYLYFNVKNKLSNLFLMLGRNTLKYVRIKKRKIKSA